MTSNLDEKGLRSIAAEYDLFFIDIWGVLHNGLNLFQNSVEVLEKLEKIKKKYVLLTNAPRPNLTVIEYLKKMGLDEKKAQQVYTSGQAALDQLKTMNSKSFFHIGPPRDFDLFKTFENQKVEKIESCDFLLCTGLFDDHESELLFYEKLLLDHIKKKMICTNPDLVVDRGEEREFCAGSVAKIFENLGGEVKYFGKPYPEVYEKAFKNLQGKKVICIGDNLNTDIKGANMQNFDSLLINNGIHKNEISNGIKELIKKYNVNVNFTQTELKLSLIHI